MRFGLRVLLSVALASTGLPRLALGQVRVVPAQAAAAPAAAAAGAGITGARGIVPSGPGAPSVAGPVSGLALPAVLAPAIARGIGAADKDPGVPAASDNGVLTRDPETGIYGLSAEQSRDLVAVLKKHYGDDLLDVGAIGSRVRGTASALKRFRPVHAKSDLDLVPLIRKSASGKGTSCFDIGDELSELLGFPVEVHTVLSFDGGGFKDSIPFYGGGYEAFHTFSSGEAVRIPITS